MNYKTLFSCLLFVLFLSCNRNAKSEIYGVRNDSVEKYLQRAENFNLSFKERDKFNKKALSFIDLSKSDTTTLGYFFRAIRGSFLVFNLEEYKILDKIYFEKSTKLKDTLNLARYYRVKGTYYKKNKILDSAIYYYNKSEKLYKKIGNKNELVYVYYNKIYVEDCYGDYLGADLSGSNALVLLKESKNYNLTYSILNDLGNINHNLKNYEKAIMYNNEALKIYKSRNLKDSSGKNSNMLVNTLNNIGNSYREMGNYEKAIYYFKKALKEELKTKKDPEIEAYIYSNLGYVYLKQKKFNKLPNILDRSIQIFDSVNNKNESAISNMYLSDYYFQKNDTVKAIAFSEKALQLTSETKTSYYYLTTLSHAGYVNQAKAPYYIKKYHEVNDSLVFEERKARNQLYKIQLDTDEIALQKDKAIKQKWVLASTIAMVLCIVILLFIVFRQKAKQRELHLLKEQQKVSESIYQLMLNQHAKEEEVKNTEKRRIAMELHDNVMNKLASTRFNLFTLSKKTDAATIENALVHIEKIKDIENEIRDITHDLNKEAFSETSTYQSLLEKEMEAQNQLHATTYALNIDPEIYWDRIASNVKMNLFRIIQEAIHNVNKHAQATEVEITIIKDENNLCMSIQDNGVGFDVDKEKKGIGLKNIQRRVELLLGKITFQSEKSKGTTLNLKIPIP